MNPTEVYSVTATPGTFYFESPGYPSFFLFWEGNVCLGFGTELFMGMFRSHMEGIILLTYLSVFIFILSFRAGVERAQIPPLLEKLICFSFPSNRD